MTIGIIGGSGLYDLPGLADTRWVTVDTPWGAPSDQVFLGRLGDAQLAFLPRHGRGHRIPPGEVNYRANIAALKQLGAADVLSLSAVGGLKEELPPGTFVVVDQFIDRTVGRASSFFGTGLVAHVSMAHPVCGRLGDHVQSALGALGVAHHRGGTYLAMGGWVSDHAVVDRDLHTLHVFTGVEIARIPAARARLLRALVPQA